MGNLNQIFNSNLSIVLLLLISGFLLLLTWNVLIQARLSKKVIKQFSPEEAKNVETALIQHSQALKSLDKEIQELYNISNQINGLAFRGIHKVGMIRFNPFKDLGGDQSFSIALLNGKNNGITITSLYTREGTRAYSKAIRGGKSEKHPLTDEEKEAIKMALAQEIKQL